MRLVPFYKALWESGAVWVGGILKLITGEVLERQNIILDGKHFVGCTLVNCILEYSGGDVAFERTLMRGCSHVFHGGARRTVHYLKNVGLIEEAGHEWLESGTVN